MPPQARRKQASARPKTQPRQESSTRAGNPVAATDQQKPEKQPIVHVLLVFPIVLTIASASLAAWIYTRALDPLYGAVATGLHLNKVVWAATLLAGFGPTLSGWTATGFLGVALCALPSSAYWTAAYTGANFKDPVVGPVVTHVAALGPVVFFAVATVRRMILLVLGAAFVSVWATSVPLLRVTADKAGRASSAIPWHILIPIAVIGALPLAIPHLTSPVLRRPLQSPYTKPASPVRILSSVQSVTGLIVVGESLPPAKSTFDYPYDLRYLRASHSLLGGVWIGSKVSGLDETAQFPVDDTGTVLGDSIYSTFVLQEAVRLVDKEARAIPDIGETALIIGLGAGISAAALTRHGVATTIVEIDPAVYNASRQYFGLPEPAPEILFLSDARRVVLEKARERRVEAKGDLYDYVIHDLFSGGAVPGHLFTLEFWEDLKTIMNPDGIVAVNYAGSVGTEVSRAVFLTLQRSFGQCRVFHDSMKPIPEHEIQGDFRNLVFFCSPSTKPIIFRQAIQADYLGSHLRANVLAHLDSTREVRAEVITGDIRGQEYEKWIIKDAANKLNEWQKPSALEHWKLMRNVLPDVFWTTY
ncbi:hypothetical protein K488DRAFT_75740 [Vararia minispora EC-137]|uniref:Uncharacterized protein n=1 Tax=Vararia minispora EC-137 TaxID=1314806 RepID=A0ACB8QXX0_9AGAM|nr:hypothetical protein K488DRAFT_75740 [Vararia minispora EC-137]